MFFFYLYTSSWVKYRSSFHGYPCIFIYCFISASSSDDSVDDDTSSDEAQEEEEEMCTDKKSSTNNDMDMVRFFLSNGTHNHIYCVYFVLGF